MYLISIQDKDGDEVTSVTTASAELAVKRVNLFMTDNDAAEDAWIVNTKTRQFIHAIRFGREAYFLAA